MELKRRNLLKWGGAVAVIVVTGAGLGPTLLRKRQVFRKTELLMGTFGEIQVVHDDARQAQKLIAEAFVEARRIERLMSRFRQESDIGRVNRLAHSEAVALSSETAGVLERALHWSKVTDGRFDPAIGHLSKLWDLPEHSVREEKNLLPDEARLASLAKRKFYQEIQLERNPEKQTVRFLAPEMQLDLGGIAKGYAVDQATNFLRNSGVEQALVNFGGDLAALGGREKSSGAKGWRIGVKDPNRPDKIAQVLTLRNQAAATSGNYEKYLRSYNGDLSAHHLIDPQSARPGRLQFHGLTVIGSNCQDTDALATGLFFQNESQTRKVLADNTENFSTIRLG